jgi:hypothetical protein
MQSGTKGGKTWNSRENAQKAIDWHTKDEKAYHVAEAKEYKEECEHVKKHNEKSYNIKSGNMWTVSPDDKPRMRLNLFYKDAEIVEFGIKET